jgi:hypothetical protein
MVTHFRFSGHVFILLRYPVSVRRLKMMQLVAGSCFVQKEGDCSVSYACVFVGIFVKEVDTQTTV